MRRGRAAGQNGWVRITSPCRGVAGRDAVDLLDCLQIVRFVGRHFHEREVLGLGYLEVAGTMSQWTAIRMAIAKSRDIAEASTLGLPSTSGTGLSAEYFRRGLSKRLAGLSLLAS